MPFSAGVMLAAAIFALLLPSLDAGQALFGGDCTSAAALSGVGLALGIGLMLAVPKAWPWARPMPARRTPPVRRPTPATGTLLAGFVFMLLLDATLN